MKLRVGMLIRFKPAVSRLQIPCVGHVACVLPGGSFACSDKIHVYYGKPCDWHFKCSCGDGSEQGGMWHYADGLEFGRFIYDKDRAAGVFLGAKPSDLTIDDLFEEVEYGFLQQKMGLRLLQPGDRELAI